MPESETLSVPVVELGQLISSREYQPMLAVIDRVRPVAAQLVAEHGKSHSQFQMALLDNAGPIAGPRPLRNLRQILASVDRTESALRENLCKMREAECQSQLLRERAERSEGAARQLLLAKAHTIDSGLEQSRIYIAGAVRKLSGLYQQCESLEQRVRSDLDLGPDEPIREKHFEQDEEVFHIMQAFRQALISFRANGKIDEGNMIYLADLGISGRLAQNEIHGYLEWFEAHMKADRFEDVHDAFAADGHFLESMADKFAGCGRRYAEQKGLIPGVLPESTLGVLTE